MIMRVVKMHFKTEEVESFLLYFDQIRHRIEAMPGLATLELYRDIHNPDIVFTMSQWKSEEDLNQYRNSDLFKQVWPKTKALFGKKAEAWSLKLK